MPSFKQRSDKKEILDSDDLSFEEIKLNMQELAAINHRLGGHRTTLLGMKKLTSSPAAAPAILHIVELGCGGGDNLRVIGEWANQNHLPVQLTGIDMNVSCITYAKEQSANAGINFICKDYKETLFDQPVEIIFSSLFCHHFTDPQLIEMLKWMKKNCTIGFFINDLHRHPLAYYPILALTQLFSGSRLVKNDAPLSVLRGFKKSDWNYLFREARIQGMRLQWVWAFRWLIIYRL